MELAWPVQKLFATHATHTEFKRYLPATHKHALLLLLAVDGLYVLGRKLTQVFCMPLSQYVFWGHALHTSWFSDANFPASHVTHNARAVVPVEVVIVPGGHCVQTPLFSV